MRPKLAVVISHPIQHFAPLFREITRRSEIDLKVFYCCDWGISEYRDPGFGNVFKWDIPLLEGYASEFLPIKKRPKDLGFFSIDNPDIPSILEAYMPDAVWIHGYSQRSSWRAYRWAKKWSRKVLYFGDSELLGPRNWKSRCFKRMILPWFFAGVDRFLTIGDNNEVYYEHYGATRDRFVRGAFPVDIGRFQRSIHGLTADDRTRLRAQAGLRSEAIVGLFVGKFISIKRPMDIVRAAHKLKSTLPNFQAYMIGAGELEPAIRSEITALGVESQVVLAGFVNQSDLPKHLWLGDILLMCSEKDPHPLVVTEAMSVGNAIIASDRIGCVGPSDAARNGENTLVYPYGDIDTLASHIERLAKDPGRLRAFQNRSLELVAFQSTEFMADAVTRAVKS